MKDPLNTKITGTAFLIRLNQSIINSRFAAYILLTCAKFVYSFFLHREVSLCVFLIHAPIGRAANPAPRKHCSRLDDKKDLYRGLSAYIPQKISALYDDGWWFY